MARPIVDPFRLRCEQPAPAGFLRYDTPGLLLGSCFAAEVGERLRRDGFSIRINPYGTAYNPITTFQSLFFEWRDIERGLVERDGGVTSHLLHSDVWARDKASLKELFEERREVFREAIHNATWLSVTLGSAWVYARRSDGLLCANLHKRPAAEFDRRLLSTENILQAWEKMQAGLLGSAIQQKIITVSPTIHGRDGLSENSLSKAVLRYGADFIERAGATYFPALEIVRDELRDYRFYAEDMQHPSAQAADVVYERFLAYALDERELPTVKAYRALDAFAGHRPRSVDQNLYRQKMTEVEGLAVPLEAKVRLREKLGRYLEARPE